MRASGVGGGAASVRSPASGRRLLRRLLRRPRRAAEPLPHPGRVIAAAFAVAIVVGTAVLSLPFATASGQRAAVADALFTATSSVCVTGLVTTDTGTYWSGFGQGVILVLIQVGGLGIMTVASVVAVLFSRRLGLRTRVVTQAETRSLTAADLRRLVGRIVAFNLGCEAVVAVVLGLRFALGYGQSGLYAAYDGVFHAISAFNNAGFSLNDDSLQRYVTDPVVTLTVAAAVIVGGLGFPVVFELRRAWRRPATWSVVTRITVTVTVSLLVLGSVAIGLTEATNPQTLGPLDAGHTVLASFVSAVMPRTAGFEVLNTSALRPETLFVTEVLMFIGGGSAGTAGGIKVTTFGLLAFVLWAEMRGDADVEVGRRRVPGANQRQALAVALLGLGVVVVATGVMLALSRLPFDQVLFETVSAFGTVGLSTGITARLPTSAQMLLVVVMFLGRIGPLTLASGLALRERSRHRQLPEERTIVG